MGQSNSSESQEPTIRGSLEGDLQNVDRQSTFEPPTALSQDELDSPIARDIRGGMDTLMSGPETLDASPAAHPQKNLVRDPEAGKWRDKKPAFLPLLTRLGDIDMAESLKHWTGREGRSPSLDSPPNPNPIEPPTDA